MIIRRVWLFCRGKMEDEPEWWIRLWHVLIFIFFDKWTISFNLFSESFWVLMFMYNSLLWWPIFGSRAFQVSFYFLPLAYHSEIRFLISLYIFCEARLLSEFFFWLFSSFLLLRSYNCWNHFFSQDISAVINSLQYSLFNLLMYNIHRCTICIDLVNLAIV